jgi:hypothetical protein
MISKLCEYNRRTEYILKIVSDMLAITLISKL